MLVERAELQIREGMEQEFSAAMADRGLPMLRKVPGVSSVQMGRGVEHPQKFMLLVHWDSMDSHIAFTKSAAMSELRSLFGPYSTGGAMEHFEMN